MSRSFFKPLKATVAAAALSLAVFAAAPAQAFSVPAPAVNVTPATNAGVSISFSYNSGYHGPRYRSYRRGYPYYYNGHYYRRAYHPYFQHYSYVQPRTGIQVYVNPRPRYQTRRVYGGGLSREHVAWCDGRYRTYDVRSDSYIARAGGPRVRCRSPYN